MTAFDVVLFFHIAMVLAAFALAGLLHGSEWLMARATTVGELRTASRPQKLGPLFGIILLALVGLGFTLLHLSKSTSDKLSFSDPFAWTGLVAAVLLFVSGPLVLGRHATALGKALAVAQEGPLTPELRAMATDRTVWLVSHASTFLALGVVLNMATKPKLGIAIADLVGGIVVGAVIAQLGLARALGSTVTGAVSATA